MTIELASSIDRWLRFAQFFVAVTALVAALVYAGSRSERDEQQTKSLEKMAGDLGKIQELATAGSAQIQVIGERVRGLEDRVTRIEKR
jgi:membrane protein implicated in regulation of membrane protease activity